MGKRIGIEVLDTALEYIRQNTDLMLACSAEPTTYAEALTLALGDISMSPADFSIATGVTGGNTPRRLIVAAKPGMLIDVSGEVNHLALIDMVDQILLLVTTTGPHPVTANGTNVLNVPSWSEEFKAPL